MSSDYKHDVLNDSISPAKELELYEYTDIENEELSHGPSMTEWALMNFIMIIELPAVLITCVLLLIMMFTNEKTRSNPSKWLIAHATICIFVTHLMVYSTFFNLVYGLSVLEATAICPAVWITLILVSQMIPISISLIMIDKFHSITHGGGNGNGIGKRAVIISLALFWLLDIIVHIISFLIPGSQSPVHYVGDNRKPGSPRCYVIDTPIAGYGRLVIFIWSAVTAIFVSIGCLIYGCRERNETVNRSIIIPTLMTSATYLFLFFSIYLAHFMLFEVFLSKPDFVILITMRVIMFVEGIAFPTIWLITWTVNGDITWNWQKFGTCFKRYEREEFQLLEDAEQPHTD